MRRSGQSSSRASGDPRRAGTRWVLAGLSLSMLLSSLGTSVANVATPTLETAFGATFGQVQWVVLAYLLAVTTLVVSAGRLGDLIGRRRLLVAGIATFTFASSLAAAAPSLWLLVAARALQGTGAAAMMALTLALASQAVPRARIGSAMGLLGTMSAIGTALGPALGGILIAGPGWRAIFLLNVPAGLVALGIVSRHLPADRRQPEAARPRFDILGTVLLAVALGAYALGMTIGSGRPGPTGVSLLVVAIGAAGLFTLAERRAEAPLIDAAMLRNRVLRAGLVTGGLVSTVMMATLVVGPFYLTRALALDPASVGLLMSVGPVVVAVAGVPAGRIADRVGAWRLSRAGLAVIAAGAALLAVTPARLGVPGYLVPIVIVTLGYALFQTANNAVVMDDAHPERRGVVSGMLNLSRNLGLVTGVSVMGAIFTVAVGSAEVSAATAAAVATGMHVTFAVAATLVVLALAVAAVGGRPARDDAGNPPPSRRDGGGDRQPGWGASGPGSRT